MHCVRATIVVDNRTLLTIEHTEPAGALWDFDSFWGRERTQDETDNCFEPRQRLRVDLKVKDTGNSSRAINRH